LQFARTSADESDSKSDLQIQPAKRFLACRAVFLAGDQFGTLDWFCGMTHRELFAKRVRRLRKAAKITLEIAAERGNITGNFWGDVERSKKVPSLDTIVAMAKGLGVSPSTLLLLEREEDSRDLRKRINSLLDETSPQQLELLHRIIKTVVEP
jgi:transcriptional regulator with XRE-family HTH domain